MDDASRYCLYCCEARGRPGGCRTCGPDAPGKDPEVLPRALRPGTVLADQYLVGRVLGSGGFGITYLGADLRLRQRIAVKEYMPRAVATRDRDEATVRPDTADDREAFAFGLERFLAEGRLLARLFDHPNVVSVLNYFGANGTGYLVMSYLEGLSLDALRRSRGGRLPEAEAVPLVLALLDGLRAVHGLGMLHRDVKPGNVYVTTDGQVKLLDFGAARYASGVRSRSLTSVLTPPYAPFEQYYDSGSAQGPWTDVYAAGVLLHVLLTGQHPPEAPARLAGEPLVPPADVPGVAVSPHVSAAVEAALSPEAQDRPRDAAAFLGLLLPPRRSEAEEAAEDDREELRAERERLEAERQRLEADRGLLEAERERLAAERRELEADRLAWERERAENGDAPPGPVRVPLRRLAGPVGVAALAAAALAVALTLGALGDLDRQRAAALRWAVVAQIPAAAREAGAAARREAEEELPTEAVAPSAIHVRLRDAAIPNDHPALASGVVFEPGGLVFVGEGGDVATIQTGVERVREGGLVVVLPGVYPAGATVKKSVHIIGGASDRDAVRIESKERSAFAWTAAGGSLRRLTIRHDDTSTPYGIFIDGGSPVIADADCVTEDGSAAIAIRGDSADPTIRSSDIHDSRIGVVLYDDARATIADNDIHGNAVAGVWIWQGADPIVRGNRLRDGKGAGVSVLDLGRGTIEGNWIVGNGGSGVYVGEGGGPILRGNTIRDNATFGIRIQASGGGTIESNFLSGNGKDAIHVAEGSDATVSGNVIDGSGPGPGQGPP